MGVSLGGRRRYSYWSFGGSTLATAMDVAQDAPAGSVMLVMLPDTGERYLSTPLFESIPAEMNDEEQALADS